MAKVLKETATLEERMDSFLNEEKYSWEGYGNSNEISYEVKGLNYDVSVLVYLDGSEFDCSTINKGRLATAEDREFDWTETAVGNRKVYKTLKGAMSYIERWTDK